MKILVTGFEPFGKDNRNISWEVAQELLSDNFLGQHIEIKCLPVSFKKVGRALCDEIDRTAPNVLIMLGQSSHRQQINVERIAINIMDSKAPDNDGYSPIDIPVCENSEIAYFSTAPIKDICRALNDANLEAKVTNSAGTYVCNTTYYEALNYNAKHGNNITMCFIHLPSLDKSPEKISQFKQAIEITIQTIIKKCYS